MLPAEVALEEMVVPAVVADSGEVVAVAHLQEILEVQVIQVVAENQATQVMPGKYQNILLLRNNGVNKTNNYK